MSCRDIQDQLIETARARELSSDLRKIVFHHAAACSACGLRLESERKLTRALGALADSAGDAPAYLEQELLKQLRVVPMRPRKAQAWVWAGMAAAAAFAFFVMSSTLPTAPKPPAPVAGTSAAGAHLRPEVSPQLAKVEVRRRARRPEPATADTKPDEFSRFVPLPNEPEIGLEEQAGMVRIQMPREDLRLMGFAVDDRFADELIQADVLVGMDGTARAIRVAD